jgi:tetratricopeptide (TPR) repeat protein
MPSAGAGSHDPFAQSQNVPITPLPPAPPPQPVLSAETRNFLGIFFLMIAVLGMLGFAIWAVGLAFHSYQIATTSGIAAKYYDQGNKLYGRGDLPAAVEQWQNAIRVSPDSDPAKKAREAVYNVSVTLAGQYLDQRNIEGLETEAKALVEAEPEKPEGHYFMGWGLYLSGDLQKAAEEYELAAQYGGNDYYAQNARHSLVQIYSYQGDQLAGSGRKEDAVAMYQKAADYCDSSELPVVQGKINAIGR